jgi:hypothetical protein
VAALGSSVGVMITVRFARGGTDREDEQICAPLERGSAMKAFGSYLAI